MKAKYGNDVCDQRLPCTLREILQHMHPLTWFILTTKSTKQAFQQRTDHLHHQHERNRSHHKHLLLHQESHTATSLPEHVATITRVCRRDNVLLYCGLLAEILFIHVDVVHHHRSPLCNSPESQIQELLEHLQGETSGWCHLVSGVVGSCLFCRRVHDGIGGGPHPRRRSVSDGQLRRYGVGLFVRRHSYNSILHDILPLPEIQIQQTPLQAEDHPRTGEESGKGLEYIPAFPILRERVADFDLHRVHHST